MTVEFKIEDGVPLPRRSGGRHPGGTPFTNAVRALRVGQSFLAPGQTPQGANAKLQRMMRAGIAGARFSIRKTDDGVRVWRVA